MQAQATLINFTVTLDGLEEQLLAEVVATERPDLEKTKVSMMLSCCIFICSYVVCYLFYVAGVDETAK